jgi:hypothetical protein
VIALGEHHLDERCNREQILRNMLIPVRVNGHASIRVSAAARREEVTLQYLFANVGRWELLYRGAHLAIRITVLEPSREDQVNGCSRDDPEMTGHCHSAGKTIVGDSDAQATLNEHREFRIADRDTLACLHRAPFSAHRLRASVQGGFPRWPS